MQYVLSIRRIVSVSALVVLIATFVLAAQSIPFDPMQGLVEVDVMIDGHAKGRFGIDTGADHFYIDRGFAKANNLKVAGGQPMRGVVGIEGHSDASTMQVRSLEIGNERLYNLDAVALDMPALIRDERARPPDGLIGYNVLRRFYVTIDYPNRQMLLQQSEPEFLQDGLIAAIPFENHGHLILVNVTFNDSVTVPMALDYCASYVFLSPALTKRLKVDTSGERPQVKKISLGGAITTENVYVSTGDMTSLKKRLRNVDLEGLIGASFLYRHKITIDYRRNRIYLHE